MAIKKAHILIITTITLIIVSCADKQTKQQIILEEYPKELLRIIHNNQLIPSFKSIFSLQIDRLNLDGTINRNKTKQETKLILTDTLRNKKIIDASIIKENVEIHIHDNNYDKIITGTIDSINLEKHFENLKIDLKTLISILSLKIFIIEKANKIVKEIHKSKTLFLLEKTKDKEKEIIEVDNNTGYIKQISFFKKNIALFSIRYKKYKKYIDFFFPEKIDLYYKETDTNLIIYLSNTRFVKDNAKNFHIEKNRM